MEDLQIASNHRIAEIPKNFNIEFFFNALKSKCAGTIWFECQSMVSHNENELIYIGFEPLVSIQSNLVGELNLSYRNKNESFHFEIESFWEKVEECWKGIIPKNQQHPFNGVLGFSSYDSIQLVENISLQKFINEKDFSTLPLFKFSLYRYLFVFNKNTSKITLINNFFEDETDDIKNMFEFLNLSEKMLKSFKVSATQNIDCTDLEFIDMVNQAKYHCQIGNVFQLVVSRKFSREYQGDPWSFFVELKKFKAQYYFYLDEVDYQITGASPETHFSSISGTGIVKPIAGTYKKSMNFEQDILLEKKLLEDPKENAEHNMLIDLARNDLSKHANNVAISKLKTIEHYNNVIHIVSQVQGDLDTEYNPIHLIKEFLPAGTLSGAPKYKAIQLIDKIEKSDRSFYGGLFGWIGFKSDINTCILIRSALFEQNIMTYRAGAGVVISSDPQKELEEVNNKIGLILNALDSFN